MCVCLCTVHFQQTEFGIQLEQEHWLLPPTVFSPAEADLEYIAVTFSNPLQTDFPSIQAGYNLTIILLPAVRFD